MKFEWRARLSRARTKGTLNRTAAVRKKAL